MRRKRPLVLIAIAAMALIWVGWQFLPPPSLPDLPADYQATKAAWLGVTWSMDAHSTGEIEALAKDLQAHGVSTIFVYVSYLKPGDYFNPTFDHAAEFVELMRRAAPDMTVLGWIGVPVQITGPDGEQIANRLEGLEVRGLIAAFAARLVGEMRFDGIHLNAEAVADGDTAFIETLQAVRVGLPPGAILSTTAHPLRLTEQTTIIPYPTLPHHWSAEYLRLVAQNSDQLALMAYDSGLFFPSDYRSWVAFQVRSSAAALNATEVELLIGVPVSEEWTFSHQVNAESLSNALYGVRLGLSQSASPATIDGIAVYPYWEMDEGEWALLGAFP